MKDIFVLILITVSALGNSQQIAKGKIINENNEPIAYALVYFPQLEKSAATDENGDFEINNVPNGSFKIIVSILGYQSKSSVVDIPQDVPLALVLKTSAIEMEEVIVSTPFHKLQNENVMKVERATMEALKSRGAITLADGITNISGVESVSTGIGIGKPVIRGLSSNRVLVYTQGIRLENQQFGDEHGLGINGSGIESVEVIKGPSSLLYGSDALGGVLYLNPERFALEKETHGELGAGYYTNTVSPTASAMIKTSGEHFRWLLRGSIVSHADYKTKLYRVTNTRFNETDIKAGMGFQQNKFKTELRYNYISSNLGLTDGIANQTKSKSPETPYQNLKNHIISAKSNLFFDKGSLDFTFGFVHNDRREFEEHEEDGVLDIELESEGPALHMQLNTLSYDVKFNLPQLGKFESIVGIQGIYQTNKNFGEEELIPDATTADFGVLGTTHVHFKTVDIQLGVRYDHRQVNVDEGISRNFNSFNASVGMKTTIFSFVDFRFNVASGFRAPNLAELTSDGTHEGTNRYEIGNADLNNEQIVQLDLSLQYKSEHIDLFGNLFLNEVRDYIYLSPTDEFVDNDPVYEYIQNDAKLYGGEYGFHLHPHPLDWLHIESSFEHVTGKLNSNGFLPLIPANSLSNTVRVEFNIENWERPYAFIKLKSVFNQDNIGQFETPTTSYDLLSAGLGATIPFGKNKLKLGLTATNILDTEYVYHLSRLRNEGILNIGRNIGISTTYSF